MDEVIALRDSGMSQVAKKAERFCEGFSSKAKSFVLEYLKDHGPSSSEVITNACKLSGIRPHDDRAFGPVYFHLARTGEITKAGICRRTKGHGTTGGNIWALKDQVE